MCVQYAFGVGIMEERDMMDDWRERFAFWWEMHPGMWCFDLKGRVSARIWTRLQNNGKDGKNRVLHVG